MALCFSQKVKCMYLLKFRQSTFDIDLSSIQLLSHVRLFATPWTAACQVSLSITNSQSLLKHISIQSVMPSNHLILCCPLLLPSIFPSIRVFSNVSSLHQVAKVLELQLQYHSSTEYSGLIYIGIDWFDLLAVQGTLKTSPRSQFKSTNSSVLSFLYGSTLTSIRDYWKNHSFD